MFVKCEKRWQTIFIVLFKTVLKNLIRENIVFKHTFLLEEERVNSLYGQIALSSSCITIKKNNAIFISILFVGLIQ